MKQIFVRDLPNYVKQTIAAFFLVRSKQTRQKKSGEPYLSMTLVDRSGEVEARCWDNLAALPAFDRDDFIKVKGAVDVFNNKPQLTVHKLRRAEESEIELGDYLACSARDPEEMFAELAAVVAAVGDPNLRALLEALLADPAIAAGVKRAPAATSLHHAYLGGLLEHILSLCGLCRVVAAHYGSLNLDLLVAAAVLHDLGKIRELEYARSASYTTEGHLLGHIVLGLQMMAEKTAALPGFPPRLRAVLEHLVVSHHGEYEFGSPKLPMFPEAMVFHFLDNLDSKLNSMETQLRTDLKLSGDWTGKNVALGRALLRREQYLRAEAGGGAAAEPPPEAQAEAHGNDVDPAAPADGEAGSRPVEARAPQRTLFTAGTGKEGDRVS
jgi:3'-5' exoribonuclease